MACLSLLPNRACVAFGHITPNRLECWPPSNKVSPPIWTLAAGSGAWVSLQLDFTPSHLILLRLSRSVNGAASVLRLVSVFTCRPTPSVHPFVIVFVCLLVSTDSSLRYHLPCACRMSLQITAAVPRCVRRPKSRQSPTALVPNPPPLGALVQHERLGWSTRSALPMVAETR